jgi:dUTP pyrophosphatase
MKVFKLKESASIPQFATEGSACFDLRVCFEEGTKIQNFNPHNKLIEIPVKKTQSGFSFQIQPQFRTLIPTGLIFSVPSNHVLKVYSRSGMSVKYGVNLSNSVGIIDSDYVEELFIPVFNLGDTPMTIYHNDRIAQAMLEKTFTYTLEEAKRRPSQKTEREGGFGSTGTE